MAKILKKNVKSVKKALERLEKEGVILGYRTVINDEKLRGGRPVRAIIEVKVTPKRECGFDYIAERIFKFSEVKTCYLVSGTYELLLVVEGKDIHQVAQFVAEKLAPLEGVRGTVTHFMLKKYKEEGVFFASPDENHRIKISL